MTSVSKLSGAMILAVALIAPACGQDALTGPSAVSGGVWKARNLQLPNFSIVEISDPASYTVEFRDGGQLAVRADCNVCSGSYVMSGDSLQIGPMACTRAYCGDTSQDTAFLAILTSAQSHGVQDEVLTINSSNGTLRLTH